MAKFNCRAGPLFSHPAAGGQAVCVPTNTDPWPRCIPSDNSRVAAGSTSRARRAKALLTSGSEAYARRSYDAARDLSVFGYGVTGEQQDDRLGLAGDGLKVVFINRPPFGTLSVSRDGDVELPTPLPPDIEAHVADLKLRAVEERIIR